MATLKKVSPLWAPAEKSDLKVGETFEITDYTALVKQGLAVLVDESGNEIPLPNSTLTCPVCYQQIPGALKNFTQHVELNHTKVVKSQQVVGENPPPAANPVPVVEESVGKPADKLTAKSEESPKAEVKETKTTEKKVA